MGFQLSEMPSDLANRGVSSSTPFTAAHRPAKEMTFDTCVPSHENASALQRAILIADKTAASRAGGLLYIYGETGVGKTHLLSAIAHAVVDLALLMIDVSKLKNDCERAWKRGLPVDLRALLIEPDVLLLDDIQLSTGNEQFQVELCSIIKLRLDAGLSVVASGNAPPSALDTIDKRLSSVLSSGAIERLDLEDPDARRKVLRRFLDKTAMPPDIAWSIVTRSDSNGNVLKRYAAALTADPEVTLLLEAQGYRLHVVRQTTAGNRLYVVAQWRLELSGHVHVVDVIYAVKQGTILTRCWSIL